MSIVVDLIILAIIAISVYHGYKKGLVSLAIKFCAFLISLIITFVLYIPIGNLIINTTNIDESIENAIYSKVNETIQNDDDQGATSDLIEKAKNGMLSESARNMSINIVYGGVILILFIAIRIILIFITALANTITKLPIIDQFNKAGGILYGVIRGTLIIYIALFIIGFVGEINPKNQLHKEINQSYIGKVMYENNILDIFFKK